MLLGQYLHKNRSIYYKVIIIVNMLLVKVSWDVVHLFSSFISFGRRVGGGGELTEMNPNPVILRAAVLQSPFNPMTFTSRCAFHLRTNDFWVALWYHVWYSCCDLFL